MRLVCFFISWIVVIGCTWHDVPGPTPPHRDPKSLDLNEDGIKDATLYYTEGIWDGIGASGETAGVTVRPDGYNTTLYKRDSQKYPHTLFHITKDTIRKNVVPPQEWYNMGAELVEIWQDAKGRWPKTWTIKSEHPSGPYYVALKIRKDNDYLIGWIKVDIDVNSGEVTIVDKAFTSNDFVVIDR